DSNHVATVTTVDSVSGIFIEAKPDTTARRNANAAAAKASGPTASKTPPKTSPATPAKPPAKPPADSPLDEPALDRSTRDHLCQNRRLPRTLPVRRPRRGEAFTPSPSSWRRATARSRSRSTH